MTHIRLSPLLRWFALSVLLVVSHLAWAKVTIAGQEIGKAKWAERTTLPSKKFKLTENVETAWKAGPVLRVDGALVDKLKGSAELFYDAGGTLVAARILSPHPRDMLKRLAAASRARLDADKRYVTGELRLRIVPSAGQDLVYVTSAAFDDQLIQAGGKDADAGHTDWWTICLWLVGGSLVLAILLVLGNIIWRARGKIWDSRTFLADYLAAFSIVGTILYVYPDAQLGFIRLVLVAYALGWGLVLAWALRTVRCSGWLPRKAVVDLLWVLPATPVLLVPVVLRNAFKSMHYLGMLLFFGQLFALAYYLARPGPGLALFMLAMSGLLGAGIARLYCAGYEFFRDKHWHPAVCAFLPLLFWPLHLIGFTVYFVFSTVVGAIAVALYMLIPALVLWFVGEAFDMKWLQAIGACLPFLGLVPGVFGLFAMGTMPTGYSSLEFGGPAFNPSTGLPMIGAFDSAGNAFGMGGFDINPANGMQMFGGMGGMDAFGNSYGFNNNDPW